MSNHRAAAVAFVLAITACAAASAQSTWDKSYNVSGKAALQVETDNAAVQVHVCGGCRAVRIHVDGQGADLSRYSITELQGGDGIHFSMKRREEHSFFEDWHARSPEVTIETPTETALNVRTGNGALGVAGVHGMVDLKTGNGAIHVENVSGAMHVNTGNGRIEMSRSEGPLTASTGDGFMTLEGRFSEIDAHTGNGDATISLLPGSQIASSSRVSSGNGSISLRVPRDLRADLTATTGHGSIRCDLPLQTTVSSDDRHVVRGTINGGGSTLRLSSGNGSISISAN